MAKKIFTIKNTINFLAFIPIIITLSLTSCNDTLQETKRKNKETKLLEEAMKRSTNPNDTIVIVTDRPMTPEEIRKYPQPTRSK